MPILTAKALVATAERFFPVISRKREEKIQRLIGLLKLRLSYASSTCDVLDQLHKFDPTMVRAVFADMLEKWEIERILAKVALRAIVTARASTPEDEVQARVAVTAVSKAYGLTAEARDVYLLSLLDC